MKDLKSKKLVIIIATIIAVLLSVIVVVIVKLNSAKNEEYRIIKVYETAGKNLVARQGIGDIDIYENMLLETGDMVSVFGEKLTLKLDDDKYLYAESNTKFELIASGNAKDSKTKINLIDGSIANELQNKLSDDSYYEINTPNSTMSVRGTIYYVSTYIGEDGKRYTKVSVFDGSVETDLILPDGKIGNNKKLINEGKEIIIFTDENNEDGVVTDYVFDEARDINYSELPSGILDIIAGLTNKKGNKIEVPKKEAVELETVSKEESYKVTFMHNNEVFAIQEVKTGEKVVKPKLQPEETGSWDYDFNLPVNEEIVINWR